MFNATDILIESFCEELKKGYQKTYGGMKRDYGEIIGWAGRMALEIISGTDTLYHNVEHTIMVTLVGQEILRGKHIRESISPEDWLHCIIAFLCHDIGYVKGVCRGDNKETSTFITGLPDGSTVELPVGSTDAALTPYHVDRGKLFVEQRFGSHAIINADQLKKYIELTRFPVPSDEDHRDTKGFPGIVRAADLLGQLSDPKYLQKAPALFAEFQETGTNAKLGYKTPADLRSQYPSFYWNSVFKYVADAIEYLQVTSTGTEYIDRLYSNVFKMEHEMHINALKQKAKQESSAAAPEKV